MKRICKECGKEFETTSSRRMFCYDKHYRTCKVCGKQFEVPYNHLYSDVCTCSKSCSGKLRTIGEPKLFITCKVCGKQFEATRSQITSGTQTCSKECRYKLAKQTCLDHFGVDNPAKAAEVQEKMRSTCLQRYGTENAMQSDEFKEKSKATCLEKYGVTSFTQTGEFLERTKATNRSRYGSDWYIQTDECKEKVRQTCISKYGVDNPGKVGAYIVDKMTHPELLDNLMRFRENPEEFIAAEFDHTPTLAEVGERCGIRDSSVGDILNRRGIHDLVNYCYSAMEDEVYRFLKSVLPDDVVLERNTFQVITPYELDIYIPEYKFAIECDPTVTHNSSLPGFGPQDTPKPRSYHKMKSDMCEERGIFLYHLFGYDWNTRKEVCKSMIMNTLHAIPSKVYARTTNVREVPGVAAYEFLDQNHRQGGVHCKVRLGLYHNDELVSLMTFSNLRNTIGSNTSREQYGDASEQWELVRFCNKCYTSVVGGASKLFKHFIQQYKPKLVVSYSDRAHTKGNLYHVLGFKEVNRSDPGYVWVNLKSDRAYSRLNAQKSNIVKFLGDDSIDLTKTETQIMVEHGYVQVFDSGTITWEWRYG